MLEVKMYINFLVLKFQDENYTVWSQRENTTYLKSEQQFETFHGMAGFAPGAKFKNLSCRVSIFFTP